MQNYKTTLLRLNLAVIAFLIVFTLVSLHNLPEQIPTHFGADGTPDAYSKDVQTWWFMLLGLVIFLNVVIFASSRLMRRFPRLVNFPGKKKVLQLPEQLREEAFVVVDVWLLSIMLVINILFTYMQWMTASVARGYAKGISPYFVIFLILLMLALSGFFWVNVKKEVEKLKERVSLLGPREEER